VPSNPGFCLRKDVIERAGVSAHDWSISSFPVRR
jgi:hypothetical protein